jgi:small multidrug resistance family-3 protein
MHNEAPRLAASVIEETISAVKAGEASNSTMPPSWLSAAGSVAAGLVRERQLHSFGMTSCGTLRAMTVVRSIALFVLAAIAEIGGAWLVWQGVREHRGLIWVGAGVVALGGYGFVATLQPDSHFGRIRAAYGGIFVAGSLIWGMVADGFRPDRFDVLGAIICLIDVVVIMYVRPGA